MGKQKAAPPMRFEPSDFSTDKYRWALEMFYLSYSEAVDYCRQSGYITQK